MSKGKKIAIISVSSVIAALVIAIIILAIVQSTFYSPNVSNADSLIIYVNGSETEDGICTNPKVYTELANNKGQKIFGDVMDKMETGSNESVLTCIFADTYKFKTEVSEVTTTTSQILENSMVVKFIFETPQTLQIDGEDKLDSNNNKIQYDSIYIVVSNTNDLTSTTAYLYDNNANKSNFKLTYLARQAQLYNYINELSA